MLLRQSPSIDLPDSCSIRLARWYHFTPCDSADTVLRERIGDGHTTSKRMGLSVLLTMWKTAQGPQHIARSKIPGCQRHRSLLLDNDADWVRHLAGLGETVRVPATSKLRAGHVHVIRIPERQ